MATPSAEQIGGIVTFKRAKSTTKGSKAIEVFRKLGRSLKVGSKTKKVEPVWLPLIPPEILVRIVSYLDVTALCAASLVSQEWRTIADSDGIWFKIYRRHFLIDESRPLIKRIALSSWRHIFANSIERLIPLTEDILEDPEDCESFVSRGVTHMELGHFEAALYDFDMAIQVCKANPGVNHNVDQGLFFARRASLHRLLKHHEEAYFDISTAIEIDPEISNYYRIRGDWWREDGFPERALQDYDSAILNDGSLAALYYNRALILLDMKHFDQALKNLEISIQLDPTNAEYYCTRGRVLHQLRDIEASLKDLENAVALNNSVSQYFHWRGRLYREKDQLDKALSDFENAVQLSGDDIDYSWRSIVYAQLKLTGAALRDIDKAIDRSPSNSFHHQYKGILNYGLGRSSHALESFSRAICLLPKFSLHFIWRAAVYYDMKDFRSCLADLDQASSLDSGEGPLFWRGLLYLHLGELKKAMYDLKASLLESKKANPAPDALPPSRVLFWLSVAYDLLGETTDAKATLARVSLAAPSEVTKASQYTELARACLISGEVGQVDRAKDLYRQMLAGNYAIDAAKTEQAHLDLLCELYPDRAEFKDIRDWFCCKKKKVYSNPLISEASEGDIALSFRADLSGSFSIRAASIKSIKARHPGEAAVSIQNHVRSCSF